MSTFKNIILKAAHTALVKELRKQLRKHNCIILKESGNSELGFGFNLLDFSSIKIKFMYNGTTGTLEMSKNGGQFYATYPKVMNYETCLSVESMIKKINKN